MAKLLFAHTLNVCVCVCFFVCFCDSECDGVARVTFSFSSFTFTLSLSRVSGGSCACAFESSSKEGHGITRGGGGEVDLMRTGDTASYLLHNFFFSLVCFASASYCMLLAFFIYFYFVCFFFLVCVVCFFLCSFFVIFHCCFIYFSSRFLPFHLLAAISGFRFSLFFRRLQGCRFAICPTFFFLSHSHFCFN